MKKLLTVFALFGLMLLLIACRPETVEEPLPIAEIEDEGAVTVVEPTATSAPAATNTPVPPPPTNTPVGEAVSAEMSAAADETAASEDAAEQEGVTVADETAADEDAVEQEESTLAEEGAEGEPAANVQNEPMEWSADPANLPFASAVWAYRLYMVTDGVTSSMMFTATTDVENNRVAYTISGAGVPDFTNGQQIVEMVAVDNTMYMVQPTGECFSFSSADFQPSDLTQGVDSFLSFGNTEYAEKGDPYEVEINGLATRHYVIDERVLAAEGVDNAETIVSGSGNVYVHRLDDGREILVKSRVEGVSTENPYTQEQQETNLIYEYELSRINETLDIQIPATCEVQESAESKYPVPPNAIEQAAMAGLYNWIVPDSADVEPLVEFYETEMGVLGWTLTNRSDLGATMLTFERNGELVQITLAPDGSGLVILLIES